MTGGPLQSSHVTKASSHSCNAADRAFLRDFEACRISADAFDHRAHVRLVYLCLCEADVNAAHRRIRAGLRRFLVHAGAPADKYHETLTRAWILAVDHFMHQTPPCKSSAAFISSNPQLLDRRILLTHYSAEALFSDQARQSFLEPDRQSIPPG